MKRFYVVNGKTMTKEQYENWLKTKEEEKEEKKEIEKEKIIRGSKSKKKKK